MRKTDKKIKNKISENFKSLIFAIIVAMIIRTFIAEPFRIPSSSMLPSMLIGDFLFVSKYSYGYSNKGTFFRLPVLSEDSRILANSTPKRGDVAVFKLPRDPKINYIKRVIGLPGDTVQVKNEIVYVNGTPLKRRLVGDFTSSDGTQFKKYEEETLSGKKYNILELSDYERFDNTELFKVPENHYFVMGDNRDQSADCRTQTLPYPFIPIENFVGRASIIFFSMDYNMDKWINLKHPLGIRFNRFFDLINKSI